MTQYYFTTVQNINREILKIDVKFVIKLVLKFIEISMNP